MDVGETIRKAIQDFILPELEIIRAENKEIKSVLEITNKRLDDMNIHLADQSRRIDAVREELTQRIDETNQKVDSIHMDMIRRMDETNNKMDSIHRDMIIRIDETNKKIDETNTRISGLQMELAKRIDEVNKRTDSFFDKTVIHKEKQENIEIRMLKLEEQVQMIKEKVAA